MAGVESLEVVMRRRRLRWYGHVERGDDGIRSARDLKVEGKRGRGRPKKTWAQTVEKDMKEMGLKREDAHDRAKWKSKFETHPADPCEIRETCR